MTTTNSSPPSLPFSRPNPLEPPAELARLRREAPVSRVTATNGEPVWLVTRYDDARMVLADRRFRLAMPGSEGAGVGANDSIFQDPPGHTRLRRLVSAAFTPRRVADLRSRTTEIAHALTEEILDAGVEFDVMEAVGFPLPITVISELLGVPFDERDNFRVWSNALLSLHVDDRTDPGTGWERLSNQLAALIARKRKHPEDDLLSALVAVRDSGGDRLSEAELQTMAITLIMAGYVTTSVAIGVGVILLIGHDQLRRLAEDPSLTSRAVDEVLRFRTVVGDVARLAAEDLQLDGVQIHAGDKVVVSLVSSNRDEQRFRHPDRFDIARPDNLHLAFSHGVHHCLGAALARTELQVVFAALSSRFPGLHLAVPETQLVWRRSDLFGDEWPQAVPVGW